MPAEPLADQLLRVETRIYTVLERVRGRMLRTAFPALSTWATPRYNSLVARLRRLADAFASRGGPWFGLRIVGNVMHDLLDELEGAQRPVGSVTPTSAAAPQRFWTFGRRWRAGE